MSGTDNVNLKNKILEDNYYFHIDTAFVEVKKHNRDTQIIKHAIIMLADRANKVSIVHPLTSFVLWKWKFKEYNTQRLRATHLCQFLNYLLVERKFEFKLTSLSELRFSYGTSFLNYLLQKNRTNASVKSVEQTLIYFYKFLATKECLQYHPIQDFVEKELPNQTQRFYTVSPFRAHYSKINASLYNNDKKPVEHTLPSKYLFAFLRTSIRVAPAIALGIYMSMFGGLRSGEVANIRHMDITPYGDSHGKGGMKVNLMTRNLRIDIRDSSGTSRVKRDRNQYIFNVKGTLPVLYLEHLKYLQKYYRNGPPPLSDALFLNRDGKAMTGKTIRYYFNKVKSAFIKELLSSDNPDDVITAINLESTKWSFHIGRGTFTNLIARVANNPYEIALARGDRSIYSALTYMADSAEMKKQIEKLLDELYDDFSTSLK